MSSRSGTRSRPVTSAPRPAASKRDVAGAGGDVEHGLAGLDADAGEELGGRGVGDQLGDVGVAAGRPERAVLVLDLSEGIRSGCGHGATVPPRAPGVESENRTCPRPPVPGRLSKVQTYGDFCPLSRAAEVFATRWTPLIIRNLLYGCRTFTEIRDGPAGHLALRAQPAPAHARAPRDHRAGRRAGVPPDRGGRGAPRGRRRARALGRAVAGDDPDALRRRPGAVEPLQARRARRAARRPARVRLRRQGRPPLLAPAPPPGARDLLQAAGLRRGPRARHDRGVADEVARRPALARRRAERGRDADQGAAASRADARRRWAAAGPWSPSPRRSHKGTCPRPLGGRDWHQWTTPSSSGGRRSARS